MWRKTILTAVLLLVLNPSESRSQYSGDITLDPVIGQVGPNEIGIGQIALPVRIKYNDLPGTFMMSSNSFMLYSPSPDPGSITDIEGIRLQVWRDCYPPPYGNTYSWQMVRAVVDPWLGYPRLWGPVPIITTPGEVYGVMFAGVDVMGGGVPAGFNEVVWKVWFVTSADDVGNEICFDRDTASQTLTAWEWASAGNQIFPVWNNGAGEICFTVVDVPVPPVPVPTGSPVEVDVDRTLTVTFDDVTSAGIITVTAQAGGPVPPCGYRIIGEQGQPVYYDIETTAGYLGDITVCFRYDENKLNKPESELKLLHEIDGDWVELLSTVDVDNNIICGITSSLSLFALAEPLPIQSIAGQVVADYPAPLTGLLGVDVDAFAYGTGDLVGTAVTDADGHYLIADLPAADYTVSLVTPLGFNTEIDEILIGEQAGQTVIADFALTCIDITANPRGIGFWKHQVGVALGGKGNAYVYGATLCGYLDMIANHFNSNEINQVIVYDPPVSTDCTDKLLVAKGLLNLKGNVGLTARAKQQLTALLLNVAAGYISQVEVISEDGATVSQAITYCDNLIDDPVSDHEIAKTICDDINNGRLVGPGVIPLSTAQIAYKQLPVTYSLAQNYPNPFNPITEICFSLPVGSPVKLEVFNSTGQSVTTLINSHVDAGYHSVTWDASDVASGVYLYRLTIGEFMETKKMVLLK
ncbi:MAG: T9SS type A sorting domain-containing protein [candidate division Zixibacteria bacterium]|nr:T9SS type A sorting domain-containing protein [candidate division Zixibacteria bacterium]